MVLINRTNKGQPHTKISLESRGVGECVKCQKWSGTPGLRSQDRTGQDRAQRAKAQRAQASFLRSALTGMTE